MLSHPGRIVQRMVFAVLSHHSSLLCLKKSSFVVDARFFHALVPYSEGLSKRSSVRLLLLLRRHLDFTFEKLFRKAGRVFVYWLLRSDWLLQFVLFFCFLPLFSLYWFQFLTIVHHFTYQACLRNFSRISRFRFWHILGFWSLAVQKWHKNANLKHVEKICLDSLFKDRF